MSAPTPADAQRAEALKDLRVKILEIPVRREWIGGQRANYVQVDEVLGWIDSFLASPAIAPPATLLPDGSAFFMASLVEADWTEADVWAEVHRLRAAIQGPTGYASWQDAATDERIKRVRAESTTRTLQARLAAAESLLLESRKWWRIDPNGPGVVLQDAEGIAIREWMGRVDAHTANGHRT